jgi:hypothetical protein
MKTKQTNATKRCFDMWQFRCVFHRTSNSVIQEMYWVQEGQQSELNNKTWKNSQKRVSFLNELFESIFEYYFDICRSIFVQ